MSRILQGSPQAASPQMTSFSRDLNQLYSFVITNLRGARPWKKQNVLMDSIKKFETDQDLRIDSLLKDPKEKVSSENPV